jgi:hypothetical protein
MNKKTILILGDISTIAILTIIGFVTHGETESADLPRMGSSFLLVAGAWFILAPWFGLFDEQGRINPKLLWRIPLAVLFVAPLVVILRAAILGGLANPIFVFVLGSTNALGLILWRGIYVFITRRSPNRPQSNKAVK